MWLSSTNRSTLIYACVYFNVCVFMFVNFHDGYQYLVSVLSSCSLHFSHFVLLLLLLSRLRGY